MLGSCNITFETARRGGHVVSNFEFSAGYGLVLLAAVTAKCYGRAPCCLIILFDKYTIVRPGPISPASIVLLESLVTMKSPPSLLLNLNPLAVRLPTALELVPLGGLVPWIESHEGLISGTKGIARPK
jgi:hypothetical protein